MKNDETILQKKIQYQEADYCGKYRLPNLISTFSDLATQNAIEVGFWDETYAKKYGWILIKQTMKMQRPISIGEDIYLSTRAGTSSKIQFTRQYDVLDIHKNNIGGVYSIWALIDIEKRRIVRPDKIGMEMPMIENYPHYVEEYQDVNQDITVEHVMTREVLYSDLDVNQHMNNYRYVEWALDVLDYQIYKEYFISELTMIYKKELAPKTKVKLYYGRKDNAFKVTIVSEDNQTTHFELSGVLKNNS